MQMDASPENYSGGNSVLNHTSSNMRSSNYYYKSKNSSSMKLENVKEDTILTVPDNSGINRLMADPKQVLLDLSKCLKKVTYFICVRKFFLVEKKED